MTNDDLAEVTRQYWLNRGTQAAKGHWKRINDEFKRRSDLKTQYERTGAQRAAGGQAA